MVKASGPTIETVTRDGFEEAVDVLSEAFFDYPVMRFVIGEAGDDYARRLRHLVSFFTKVRFSHQDLVLAVVENGNMVAVANINRPRESPLEFAEGVDPLEQYRRAVWDDLGPEARSRYEAYGAAADKSPFPEPHYHLGMIGAARAATGKGYARLLLDHLHDLSANHSSSRGVSLATEKRLNITLYEHFGYKIVAHEEVGEGLETWGFFRSDHR
jgi:GNAT superfamily N-acetyltransferase